MIKFTFSNHIIIIITTTTIFVINHQSASDPDSIKFFESIGCDYLSCASNDVPLAKIAAAQVILFSTVSTCYFGISNL